MKGDAETLNIYQIASHLRKSIGEVLDLPAEEIRGWTVFLAKHPQSVI